MNDELALLWMVNMGCIDMNTWYSRVDKPERPDFVLFDLDPSDDVGFEETVQVALLVKQALDTLGLESFPKTSGVGRDPRARADCAAAHLRADEGVRRDHRVGPCPRPLRARHDRVDEGEAPRRAHRLEPERRGEDDRLGLFGRPRAGAPVSTPLRWDEVNERLDPASFTMDAVRERIEKHGDLFEPVLRGRQSLTAALESVRASRGESGK